MTFEGFQKVQTQANPQEQSLSERIHQDEFKYSGFTGKHQNDRSQLGIETSEGKVLLGGKNKNEDEEWQTIERELRKMQEKDVLKEPTADDRNKAARELNHETNGMVEPGKETAALRQANEALLKGNLKNFGEAFKNLTIEERKHVAEAMNQAFEKKGSNTRVTVDKEGNLIISSSFGDQEGPAVKIDPNTGKSREIKGKCHSDDFITTGTSATDDGTSTFKNIADQSARDLQPKSALKILSDGLAPNSRLRDLSSDSGTMLAIPPLWDRTQLNLEKNFHMASGECKDPRDGIPITVLPPGSAKGLPKPGQIGPSPGHNLAPGCRQVQVPRGV